MPAIDLPRRHHTALQELGSRVLERRALECDAETLARDLLDGFHDVCMHVGLDGVLRALEAAHGFDIPDGSALAEDANLRAALVARLENKAEFDAGGPRNAKPKQLADCLAASLGLVLVDDIDRTATFTDDVRLEVIAAVTGVIDAALAVPQIREAIVTKARELCEARHHSAFDKIAAQLDDRGMRMMRQPKVPLDAVQAVQQALADARYAIIEAMSHTAIDRAKRVLERADAEAAARIDQPITHTLTPRIVAIRRTADARFSKVAAAVVHSLTDSLAELAQFAWRSRELPVRPYSASLTFAVGDLLDHPKFGRGSVVTSAAQRIEVQFPESRCTLVHARSPS
ncbi:MAG: hypothetical protein ABI867_43905 [Kofleriaceae bacterium]